jgi:hypothetical protein
MTDLFRVLAPARITVPVGDALLAGRYRMIGFRDVRPAVGAPTTRRRRCMPLIVCARRETFDHKLTRARRHGRPPPHARFSPFRRSVRRKTRRGPDPD